MKHFSLRLWDPEQKTLLYSSEWGDLSWHVIEAAQAENRLMICSGVKDMEGNFLYEGDFVKVFNTYKELLFFGQMIFKNGQFMLETSELSTHSRWINYEMICVGNKFETPGMLQQED
jgi:hypothetical protein